MEWCRREKVVPGGMVPLETAWRLATSFYYQRVSLEWTAATGSHLVKLMTNAGLTSPFWSLG